MEIITLNINQLYKLLKVIEQTKPELFNEIAQLGKKCQGIRAEYDSQGEYILTLKSIHPIYSRTWHISLDSVDNIHNYIMNESCRVSPCD